jgi:hypothetical protein
MMAGRKRAKRPKIDRTEPDRNFTAAFRKSKVQEPAPETAAPDLEEPVTSVRDASYEAINSGYRIIDEYMRQGQRIAEDFWLPATDATSQPPEHVRMMERFLRSAGDMGSAWLEMMTQWTRPAGADMSPRGTAGPFTAGRTNGHATAEETHNGAPHPAAWSIAVESSRPVRVSVETHGRLEDIEASPLVSTDRSLPPITTPCVEVEAETGRALLRVAVADDQPPGTYHGVLLDRRTQRPGGTITLRVQ